ncbi:transcription-repair coupling factor [Permianibacter aggregans]|uniref:Transcription-repair-coupling factor n=1 Tax=Permianibacter aggregans TaxID=1510150 RepID=A0A4R6UBW5_9GAMM|nr:transcription-repair coupling factor [Permianibacter aggregans]QGX38241.1 transcription-repair coupling factor [Permianibacter aggregans]TDQ44158.1 transcription-repair coupling factor [Permianibacter aggregans]
MLAFLRALDSLKFHPGFRTPMPTCHGAAQALALAHLARQRGRMLVAVTADSPSAMRLEQELKTLAPDVPIRHFPDWETLPYDTFSPHQDIVSERLSTLVELQQPQQGILLLAAPALLMRVTPKSFVNLHSLLVKVGDRMDLPELRRKLEQSGYRCVAEVMEHGEFAVRGALVDLFPMGSEQPFRLDFFDDEIESIRVFDVDSQLSRDSLNEIRLLPAHEFPWNDDGITAFRQAFRARFDALLHPESIYGQISKGYLPAGIEYYLPLFFPSLATLFDYLPSDSLFVTLGNLQPAVEHFWRDLQERYEERRVDTFRPLVAPGELYLKEEELFATLKNYERLSSEQTSDVALSQPLPNLNIDTRASVPFSALQSFSLQHQGRLVIAVDSAGRREVLLPLFKQSGLEPELFDDWQSAIDSKAKLALTVAPVERGFISSDGMLALVTEADLFGAQMVQQRRRRAKVTDPDAVIRDLSELRIGDPVVHIEHGVGRYQGLQIIDAAGVQAEYLVLEYSGNDKLYVPVQSLHLIGRYLGAAADAAPWHKLGTEQWSKARQKAAEKIRDVAVELLDLHARRAASEGLKGEIDELEYQRFAAGFAFEETPDQEASIKAVLNDLKQKRPMDRLVCGDVGFGKTEVAMRAAFAAVQNGWQVAVLVPTTLLAQQHYNNFTDRFADWPIRIELLSRFKTDKEQKVAIEAMAEGKADIVIGTHKLIQGDIRFAKLGLLIVDEEHRFGVRQKEQIKALAANVHLLTLTATPIPRTLNMALSGIRDLSLITTPPARRLSIKTFVRERNDALIKEAILRETMRGGQAYFLHNDVDSIEVTTSKLQDLLPDVRFGFAHGQMRERELERIMRDFYHQRFQVLVCTTIVETGIDIPTANTMIIDRADKFGLAQLHQLRGRVGRSHHQAYAYLLTPPPALLTPDAQKRLEAIETFDDLGAGFLLASQDLEIRGAGELLGEDQSGQIEGIGLSLYMELLDNAVQALKDGKEPTLPQALGAKTEIECGLPALLPDDYVTDIGMRLSLYKRIASAKTPEALEDLQSEIVDRFGVLPTASGNLFKLAAIRLDASKLGLKRIEISAAGGRVEFSSDTQVDPMRLIELVQKQPQLYRFEGPQHIRVRKDLSKPEDRLPFLQALIQTLSVRK